MSCSLSIVVPVYNECAVLPELYERLSIAARQTCSDYELIMVNDGSTDKSLGLIKQLAEADPHLFYIDLSRNFGQQVAISAGLDYCRGKAVVIIDGDLQDPPELIPQLYQKHMEGYEVVYAQRRHRSGEGWIKRTTAKLFYRFLHSTSPVHIPLDTGDFRLIDRKIVDCLKRMPERNKFLRAQISWIGYRQTAVLFDRDPRRHGRSGYSFGKMFTLAIDGITGFTTKPLEWVVRLGFFVSIVSFLLILYALASYFFVGQTMSGWTSLLVSTMFIGGVQLLAIGTIGSYISRINQNVVNRPLYLVAESNCSLGSELPNQYDLTTAN